MWALARGLHASPSTPLYDAFEGALKNARAGRNRRSSETERRCKTSRSIAVRIEREVALRHIAAGASQEANTMTMQPLGRSSRETIAPPRCCLRAYFTADLWKKGHRIDVRSMLRRELMNTPRGPTLVGLHPSLRNEGPSENATSMLLREVMHTNHGPPPVGRAQAKGSVHSQTGKSRRILVAGAIRIRVS